MRLVRLGLVGFGRFVGRTIDLGPGFNVVFGPNEAGKSTIQKFILGMFYGLKKQGTRRDYTPDHGRFQPWGSDDYRGVLTYTLDNDHTYRIERDFSIRRERVTLYDDLTGEDLTGSFAQDRRKEVLFAERHLRVGEGVFVSTAWVGQLETSKLAMARELSTRVANLQESGREDLSVREALRILEEQIKEIGTERAPTRPYARTLRLIEERESELQRALQAREETLEWEERLGEVLEQLERVSAETDQVAARYDLIRLRESDQRLERARSLGSRVQELRPRLEQLRHYANFPAEAREEVQRLAVEATTLGEQEEQAARRLSVLTDEKDALEAEVERFRALAALGSTAISDLSTAAALWRAGERQAELVSLELGRVSEAANKLEETLGPLQGIAERGADVTARAEALEKEIAQIRMRSSLVEPFAQEAEEPRPAAAPATAPRSTLGAVLGIFLGLLLAVAGVMYQLNIILPQFLPGLDFTIPLALEVSGGLLVVVGVISMLRGRGGAVVEVPAAMPMMPRRGGVVDEADDLAWRQRLRELETERERILADVRASSAADLKSRLIRWEQFAARRESYQARLQTLQAELENRREEVAAQRQSAARILAAWQGVPPEMASLDEAAVEDFRQAWQRWTDVRQRFAAVSHDFAETAERHRGLSERLARASEVLDEHLRRAGVDTVQQYLQGCRGRDEFTALRSEYEGASQGLEQALRGERLEALEAQATVLRQRRAEAAAGGDGLAVSLPEGLSSAMLQEELRVLEHRRSELQQVAADLSARLETSRRDVADLADLQRELESLREDLAAMDRELQSLELARDTIDMVSGDIHREFAPVLNQTIGAILANVTGGRYTAVKVDENLGLRALADGDRLVEVWDLSSGTVDQFYFALRLALVDLITAGSERLPLLLDDPFVQYDDDRLRGALTYLQHLSRDGSQIVLFTCHRRDVEVARALGSRVVDLTGM